MPRQLFCTPYIAKVPINGCQKNLTVCEKSTIQLSSEVLSDPSFFYICRVVAIPVGVANVVWEERNVPLFAGTATDFVLNFFYTFLYELCVIV